MDPATATILASALSMGAQGAGEGISAKNKKKTSKLRSKEMRRETHASALNEALQRNAELQGQSMSGSSKLARRGASNLMDTATLLREAFGI